MNVAYIIGHVGLLIAFVIASYVDLKKMEIPLWDFPSAAAVYIAAVFISGNKPDIYHVLGFLAPFVVMIVASIAGNIGGGDIIMFSCTGFILGLEELVPYMVFLTVCGIVLLAIFKFRNRMIPIAPLAGTAYILYLVWRCLYV